MSSYGRLRLRIHWRTPPRSAHMTYCIQNHRDQQRDILRRNISTKQHIKICHINETHIILYIWTYGKVHNPSVSCLSESRFFHNFVPFQQGDQVHKSVFIIFFQGDQLKNRVKKICEGQVLQKSTKVQKCYGQEHCCSLTKPGARI